MTDSEQKYIQAMIRKMLVGNAMSIRLYSLLGDAIFGIVENSAIKAHIENDCRPWNSNFKEYNTEWNNAKKFCICVIIVINTFIPVIAAAVMIIIQPYSKTCGIVWMSIIFVVLYELFNADSVFYIILELEVIKTVLTNKNIQQFELEMESTSIMLNSILCRLMTTMVEIILIFTVLFDLIVQEFNAILYIDIVMINVFALFFENIFSSIANLINNKNYRNSIPEMYNDSSCVHVSGQDNLDLLVDASYLDPIIKLLHDFVMAEMNYYVLGQKIYKKSCDVFFRLLHFSAQTHVA